LLLSSDCDGGSGAGELDPTESPASNCPVEAVLLSDNYLDFDAIALTEIEVDYIKFTANQVFWQGEVCGISTLYNSSVVDSETLANRNTTCDSLSKVPPGAYGEFTAKCYEGYAYVSIFVYQPAEAMGSYPDVPEQCQPLGSDYTARHDFAIKCGDCPEPEKKTCAESTNPFALESFDTEVWQFGTSAGGAMDVCGMVAETFDIPIGSMEVKLRFILDETVHGGIQEVLIRIGEYSFDLNTVFDPSKTDIENFAHVGYFFDAEVSIVSTDLTTNVITITIPDSWYSASNRLTVGFEPMSDGCIRVDNLELSSNCESFSCPVDAILDTALSSEEFDVSAIEVLQTNSMFVTFAVSQEFSHLTLCTVATWFKDRFGDLECPYDNSVPPGEIDQYEALCDPDGYARVSVLVYDPDYATTGVSPQVTAPTECKFTPGLTSNQLSRYNYRIPCTPDCPLVSDTCQNGESFYTSSDIVSLDSTVTEFGNTIATPIGAKNVYLKFDVVEKCDLGADDKYYIRVSNNYYLDPGQDDTPSGNFGLGYYDDIEVVTRSSGQSTMTYTLNLPPAYFADNRLVWGVKLVTSTGCVDVTSVNVSAHCEADCDNSVKAAGGSSEWIESDGSQVTTVTLENGITIAGRLGVDENGSIHHPSATFVGGQGLYMQIELTLWTTNLYQTGDVDTVHFSVESAGQEVFLELSLDHDNIGSKADNLVGWVRQDSETDSDHGLTKFTAFITVHGTGANYEGFNVVYTAGNQFGIESYTVTSVCTKPEGARKLDSDIESTGVDQEEDFSYYCLAKDFPCEGGEDFVHVCHYSARLGYQTFCIPESDSEVLRFYAKDYCGPCIGGFAA
jgi:hypothetical protein